MGPLHNKDQQQLDIKEQKKTAKGNLFRLLKTTTFETMKTIR